MSEKERLGNDAWKKGGLEEERRFKEEWVKKEQQKIYNGVVAIMKYALHRHFWDETTMLYVTITTKSRMRDANLAKRGIDPSSVEEQIAAVEERGRELLEKYKEEIGGKENARDIIRVIYDSHIFSIRHITLVHYWNM